jgi:hypothetical protein
MMFVPSAGTLARRHYTAFSSQVGTGSSLEKAHLRRVNCERHNKREKCDQKMARASNKGWRVLRPIKFAADAVVALLEQELGRQVHKELLPMQPGDVPETYADIEDLIRDIDFRPATPIE